MNQRFELLSQAGTRIGTTLDVMRTAQELADIAVPAVADYITVDLADSVTTDKAPLRRLEGSLNSIPAFYRAGRASIHPDAPESIWSPGEAVYVPPASPFTEVLATQNSHFEPELDTGPGNWLDLDRERLKIILATGMHSLMIVPLIARQTVLGVAVFVRTDNPAAFICADLALAEGLAERAALSLDNARRFRRERTTALALQRDLLPRQLDGGSALEIAARYLPSDRHGGVGGDWYDTIPLSAGRIALVVGDVAGHGINAAATMGQLRTAVLTLSNLGLPPAEILTHLDRVAVDLSQGRADTDDHPCAMSATCIYLLYDPALNRCTIASAGHPPPAVIAPDGSAFFADIIPGPPIGVGSMHYTSTEIDLPEGSTLVLYTDGLIESRRIDLDQGLNRLRTALTRQPPGLEELADTVITAMTRLVHPEDDVALLIARTRPTQEPAPAARPDQDRHRGRRQAAAPQQRPAPPHDGHPALSTEERNAA